MKDCPRKVRRVAQEAQQEASPPRESPPAPVERPALPSSPPPPAARPSTPPAATQSSVQETIDVRVEFILRPHGPQFAPPPAPEPLPHRASLTDIAKAGIMCTGEPHPPPPLPQTHSPQACNGDGSLEILHRNPLETCTGEADPGCTCEPRYRPAYELADGSLERAGRAGGAPPPPSVYSGAPAVVAAATALAA